MHKFCKLCFRWDYQKTQQNLKNKIKGSQEGQRDKPDRQKKKKTKQQNPPKRSKKQKTTKKNNNPKNKTKKHKSTDIQVCGHPINIVDGKKKR